MISLFLLLLHLSTVGLLLLTCGAKKTKKDESGSGKTALLADSKSMSNNTGETPPPGSRSDTPDRKGDKLPQTNSKSIGSIKNDGVAGSSVASVVKTGVEAKSKASKKEDKPGEKGEKDKTEEEKTKYGITEYMDVKDDKTDKEATLVPGKSPIKEAKCSKKELKTAEVKKDEKKEEKKGDGEVDKSQVETVLKQPKTDGKTVDLDVALASTPPTCKSAKRKQRRSEPRTAKEARTAKSKVDPTQQSMDIKKKPKKKVGINDTQVTERSAFLN